MFPHPYEPYDVQKAFMRDMYDSLAASKVVMLESPTGTGKTLSLLCAGIAFARDSDKRALDHDIAVLSASKGPQWTIDRAKELRIQRFKDQHSVDLSNPKKQRFVPSMQIFFASRTHTQLKQVSDAVQAINAKLEANLEPRISFAVLASRKQLCIQPQVRALKSPQEITDKCTDMQKNGSCKYREHAGELMDASLNAVMDIEDLVKEGEKRDACPYYSARSAAEKAEIIALPYPLLLSRTARKSLGIDLKNSLVIVDEAHNLIPSISDLYSAELTEQEVDSAFRGLIGYLKKFDSKLAFSNKRRIDQLVALTASVKRFFEHLKTCKQSEDAELRKSVAVGTEFDVNELLKHKNVDTLNFVDLHAFIIESKLVFKIDGYADPPVTKKLGLAALMDFVMTAIDPVSEGKLFIDQTDGKLLLKRLTLDPSDVFKDLLIKTHSVVLAGGTMEPFTEFEQQLKLETETTTTKSYSHVIPQSQILVKPVSDLEFTFANRTSPEIIDELGSTLLKCVKHVPNGVVAFFPGYSYLETVIKRWKATGMWQKLEETKELFSESQQTQQSQQSAVPSSNSSVKSKSVPSKPPSRTATPATVFLRYSKAAIKERGALLLAVVGGSLSEGINFSDELARAVIMIGLPFPNAFSAEMRAKKAYIERTAMDEGLTSVEAKERARLYYENLAMRAVNQSIGRAVRHLHDYSAIFLVDKRYKLPRVQSKLSKWIRSAITGDDSLLEEETEQFFEKNKDTKTKHE